MYNVYLHFVVSYEYYIHIYDIYITLHREIDSRDSYVYKIIMYKMNPIYIC